MVTDSVISTGTKCTVVVVVAYITICAVVLSLVTVDTVRSVAPERFFFLLSVWGLRDVITITNFWTSTCANYVNLKCANLNTNKLTNKYLH